MPAKKTRRKKVQVKGHFRRTGIVSGTHVKPHTRMVKRKKKK